MNQKQFIEEVFEIAYGENAINRNFTFEEVIETLREFSNIVPLHDWPNQLQNLFEDATLRIPSNSLRGGTTEIMKGIIARQLGLRWLKN